MKFIANLLIFISVFFFIRALIALYHLIGFLVHGEDYIDEYEDNDIFGIFDDDDDDDIWQNFSREVDDDE